MPRQSLPTAPSSMLASVPVPLSSLLCQIHLGCPQAQGFEGTGVFHISPPFPSCLPSDSEGSEQKGDFQVVRQMARQEAGEPAGTSFTSGSPARSVGHMFPSRSCWGFTQERPGGV